MDQLAIVLSNVALDIRPAGAQPVAGSAFTAMFPDQHPPWRFACRYDGARMDELQRGLSGKQSPSDNGDDKARPILLRATSHGARAGGPSHGPTAMWLVLVNAADGKEAEFNHWYDSRHIHDTLAIPGFVSGQRYTLSSAAGGQWKYLTLYEIVRDQVAASLAEAGRRRGTDLMPNPGMLAPGTVAIAFEPVL